MKAINFPQANVFYAENQPEYETLPSNYDVDDPYGTVISCWQMDTKEIEHIRKTGKIWLHVLTFHQNLQPLLLNAYNPFATEEDLLADEKPTKQHFMSVYNYQTKNRAHKEFQEFVNRYHHCVVDDTKLQEIIKEFEGEILNLKQKYPRCDVIKMETWSHEPQSMRINVSGNFAMDVFVVRQNILLE